MLKKLLSLLLAIALLFSISACTGSSNGGDDPKNSNIQEEFAAFVDEQYKYSIEQDYTAVHIYYLNPEAAGFNMDNVEVSFGLAPNDETMKEDRDYYNSLLSKLKRFDRSKLTRRQQDEYDSLEWEIKCALAMSNEKFDYYKQLFATPNSLESELVSFLSVWEIRNEQDAKDFSVLIDSLPAYVDSCLEYAKIQQEKELFMTDFDEIEKNCNDILETGIESFVISKLISQVDSIDGLDSAKKDQHKQEIRSAFERSYFPAIQKIKDGIASLKGGYNNSEGLAAFPHGAEYFEAILNFNLGYSDNKMDDFKKMIENRKSHVISRVTSMYADSFKDLEDYYNSVPTSGYNDYTQILNEVKTMMLKDYPEVKDLNYEISNADAEEKLDEKNVAAYFIIPPLDGDHKQRMRVNPNNDDIESLDTYMTVTHEGFPGHMYQYAYVYGSDASDYIKTLGVDAITEGYAVYTQYHALEYLDQLSDAAKLLPALDSRYSYLLYCEMDLGINYDGWSLDDTYSFLERNGVGVDNETAKEIYDFLRFSPGVYEPYALGYEFIEGLRDNAEKKLKDKFNAADFNKALLDAGSTPCNVVSRYVEEYINSAK